MVLKYLFLILTKKISEFLTSTKDIFNTGEEIFPFSPDDFKLNEPIELENILEKTQFIQDSYFLYDKNNLIKKSFITELNKFISIYGSISYFGNKKINKPTEIISSNNPLEFFIEEKKQKAL